MTWFLFPAVFTICSQNELIEALDFLEQLPLVEIKNNNRLNALALDYRGTFPTVTSWIDAFQTLPKNRKGADFSKHSGFAACGSKSKQWLEFENVLNGWLSMNATGPLLQNQNWHSVNKRWFNFWRLGAKTNPGPDFFDISGPCAFAPFAQKLIAQPGDVFYFHGDLHGDIFSLLEEIKELKNRGVIDDSFRIVQDNVWFVFLGDYVDRGQYGCEVIYTMMRLALANPDRVIAVRGNHEDIQISSKYGFEDEVAAKFSDLDGSKFLTISRINDFLPVVFYLGCSDSNGAVNYVQCCHGGIEEEYKPQSFLDDRKTIYQLLPKFSADHSCCSPFDRNKKPLGFMWNDFDVDNQNTDFKFIRDRGFSYGKKGTQRVLQTMQSSAISKIRGILRAHQHVASAKDSMMKGLVQSKGLYKLWNPYETVQERYMDDGLVWTFNVGPDSIYGDAVGFNFDTYVELMVAQEYKSWVMKVFNTNIL